MSSIKSRTEKEMYIERSLKKVFHEALRFFPAVLITGPRQSGKTTFLKHEMPSDTKYVTFDDPRDRQFALDDPNGFLEQFGDAPVILDEIQYVPSLFSYIKMRIDENRDKKGIWIMTGSQQFNMMKDVSDSLAGRIAVLKLLPFNYQEVMHLNPDVKNLLWHGLYPECMLNPESRDLWLSSYIQTYIERDVRQLIQVKDPNTFQLFLNICAAQHGRELNIAAISRKCGMSQPTVKQWLSLLEASSIIFLLKPYHSNLGKRLIKSPKLYFLDPAIPAFLTKQPDAESLFAGSMGGEFFEGFIISEVYKILNTHAENSEIFFWKSQNQLEIDLLLEQNGEITPIEIKKTATPTSKHAESMTKILSTSKMPHNNNQTIVCTTKKSGKIAKNIQALSWQDFLKSIDIR